jgi:hypothetical protein
MDLCGPVVQQRSAEPTAVAGLLQPARVAQLLNAQHHRQARIIRQDGFHCLPLGQRELTEKKFALIGSFGSWLGVHGDVGRIERPGLGRIVGGGIRHIA